MSDPPNFYDTPFYRLEEKKADIKMEVLYNNKSYGIYSFQKVYLWVTIGPRFTFSERRERPAWRGDVMLREGSRECPPPH